MWRLWAVAASGVLLLAACGDDSPVGVISVGLPYHSCNHVPSIEADVPAELGPWFELRAFEGERLVAHAAITPVDAPPDGDGDGVVHVFFGVVKGVFPKTGRDSRFDLELTQNGRLVARGVYECVVLQ